MASEQSDEFWKVAPCEKCGIETEGEVDSKNMEWICSSCWPSIERTRLRESLRLAESVVEAARNMIEVEEERAVAVNWKTAQAYVDALAAYDAHRSKR